MNPGGRGGAAEGFDRIEKELQAERAAALARIAGRLEELVRELAALAAATPDDPAESLEWHRRYTERRELALRYRWYLEVQRESVGITRHDGLDEMYPIPPGLPP